MERFLFYMNLSSERHSFSCSVASLLSFAVGQVGKLGHSGLHNKSAYLLALGIKVLISSSLYPTWTLLSSTMIGLRRIDGLSLMNLMSWEIVISSKLMFCSWTILLLGEIISSVPSMHFVMISLISVSLKDPPNISFPTYGIFWSSNHFLTFLQDEQLAE